MTVRVTILSLARRSLGWRLSGKLTMPGNINIKLGGYAFYEKILGSPRYIVAPMVDQSELAWRILSRRYGANLVYTPMINAKLFIDPKNPKYKDLNFNIPNGEEGGPADRPLIVQFCGNDPDILLKAAKLVEPYCDAVDINLGCPQDIARRGHYGCFLQDDWDLVHRLINILHMNLSIPVTAKFRVFPSVEQTVQYAQMMENAGAQILTCHGRLREQRGVNSGLADWDKIRAVKEAVKIPVFANGNILYASDVIRCLQHTGADGVMSAEGQLYNPALFTLLPRQITRETINQAAFPNHFDPARFPVHAIDMLAHPPHADLALEYLEIVKSLKTNTALSAVKGHLFKIMKPAIGIETDLRDKLGKVRGGSNALAEYEEICREMKARLNSKAGLTEKPYALLKSVQVDPETGMTTLPEWLAQPYIRPLPPVTPDKGQKSERFVKNATDAIVPVTEATERVHSSPQADVDLDDDFCDNVELKRINR